MIATSQKLALACALAISFLIPSLTRAEPAVQAWVQRYNGPGNGEDYSSAVAVDSGNNVIVTGHSVGSGTGSDYLTIKYSNAGVPLWTNRYNGPGNGDDGAQAIALDDNNDVVVTGGSVGSGSQWDLATIKYSSAGVPLWTNRFNGSGNDSDVGYAVRIDASNNVVVTGCSVAGGSAPDYVTIKYSEAGLPLWTNYYNGAANSSDSAFAMDLDGDNNVVVTGVSVSSAGAFDYATIKYSTEGVPLWTNWYSGPSNAGDDAKGVAVDGDNNVIVTGTSYGSGGQIDYATIKYSSTGVPLWTNLYNEIGYADNEATALAVDSSNNVIVTGMSGGPATSGDYATIKYSSSGIPLWTNRYNGPANDYEGARAVAVDGKGNVLVTGRSITSKGAPDFNYVTIKYSSAGLPLWTNEYSGPGSAEDMPNAVAVDHNANVVVTGRSAGSGGDFDFATIKYLCVLSPLVTGRITNGTFQLRVEELLQPGTLVIEASTNLSANPPDWLPVFTNTTPTNVLVYTDPEAPNAPTRFYRAFQSP